MTWHVDGLVGVEQKTIDQYRSYESGATTGHVTFTFNRGTRTRTVPSVPVTNGEATTNWRVPRNWPRGATTIRAT